MDNLTLTATLISQLALIVRGDPDLGEKGEAITEVLGLLGTLVLRGEAARAELEVLAAQVQEMVASDRPPTRPEWQGLRDLSRQYHEELNPGAASGPVG